MNDKILIIEDEKCIYDAINYSLTNEGFETEWVQTGKEGLDLLESLNIALIILDIGLPDLSGIEIIKRLRLHSNIPVVFLTARSDEIDRILGLELGADDYVVKPFSPRELTARVKTILRRTKAEPKKYQNKTFIINEENKQIFYKHKLLDLTWCEYEILLLLIKKPERVYTRNHLNESINSNASSERTIDAHIKNIRNKLKAIDPNQDPIMTKIGHGYYLKHA